MATITNVGTTGIKDTGRIAEATGRTAGSCRFLNKEHDRVIANFGERRPVYQPSSGFASRVASSDMAVTSSSSVTS